MSVFFIRSSVILALFLSGALLGSLTDKHFLAVAIWFIAVSAWTLLLGFRKALWIIIPFLLMADVLWDGTIGSVFLFGFVLATATTYLAVRIEDHSAILRMIIGTLLVSLLASLAVIPLSLWYQNLPTLMEIKMIGSIFLWQLALTIILFVPVNKGINRIETWLDISHHEQIRKIR